MITAVASTATYVKFRLFEFDGTPIEGAVIGDFATEPVAKLLPSGATTATPTITEIGDGLYCAVFSSGLAVGDWDYYHVYDADNDWTDDIHVITAAQADPLGASVGDYGDVATIGGRIGNLDAAVSSRAPAGATITTSNPVSSSGERLTLRIGDDYSADLENAPYWNYTGPVDLTGATVELRVTSRTVSLEVACGVTDPGEATQVIAAELTDAQTAQLLQREVTRYAIVATIAGDETTLFTGKVTVQAAT